MVSDATPFTDVHNIDNDHKEEEDDMKKKQESREPILASQSVTSKDPKDDVEKTKDKTEKADTPEEKLMRTLQPNTDDSDDEEDEDEIDLDDHDLNRRTEALTLVDSNAPASKTTLVQTNIKIDTVNGPLNIGPQITNNIVSSGQPRQKRTKSSLSESERDRILECGMSRRMLDEDDILKLSRKVGSDWKSVGNALKLNYARLDAIDVECKTLPQKVEVMMMQWLNWKCERATVARMSKALFNSAEYDAILCLKP